MKWIKVSEELPPVDPNTGESEYVFVYGHGCLPQTATYSNGKYAKEGWCPSDNLGEVESLYWGRGAKRRLRYTHWAEIELPKED